MKKMMIIILAVGFVFVTGLLILERGRSKNLEAQAKAEKEKLIELENQNRGLDIRLRMYAKMNEELEKKLSELEKQKAELNEKLRQSEKRLQEIQDQVAAMEPDEMVQQTRRILADSGVEKIDAGARFSLAAFRKNTEILLQWEEFSLAKIPALEKKAENLEKANLNLQNQVFLRKEAERLWRQKNTLWLQEKMIMNGLIINYEKQLSGRRREKWYYFFLGALAGAGAHALLK